jgi:hypothetical protein
MIDSEKYWIIENSGFYDIKNSEEVFFVEWNKKIYDDFIMLAEAYYSAAHVTLTDIVESGHDNIKSDQWFLPGMYMYRHAIELLCKGLVIGCFDKNNDITAIFTECKHDLDKLFCTYKSKMIDLPLAQNEKLWVETYLSNLETVDSNSDLFRYPFRDGYFSEYNNEFLDIVDIANGFEQCYSILFKCVEEKYHPLKYAEDIDYLISDEFLHFAEDGIGNCMLYDSPWGDGFHVQIEGYSAVAEFLFGRRKNNQWSFFPIAFLIRNAVELSLKRLLWSKNEFCVSEHIRNAKKRSHLLYKDLWKSIKPVIEHYANESNEDLKQVEIAEKYIQKFKSIDKNGAMFRYPVTYGLQHKFNGEKIDFVQAYSWMQGVFNFLDGCGSMISAIYEYECEMRSYHE